MAEFELPDAIIHHILSFLSRKDAAKTSVISKSWYTAWSTRPILEFDERDFGGEQNGVVQAEFSGYMRRILQRYKDLNLKVDKFALWMKMIDDGSTSLANELILDVLNLGVNDVNLKFWSLPFVLPVQVFTALSLTNLCLYGCKIDWCHDRRVMCSRLTWLNLDRVSISDEMLRNVILGCPLIENFFVVGCDGLTRIDLGKLRNLKKFGVDQSLVSKKSLTVDFEDRGDGSLVHNRVNVPEFRYLSFLVLKEVKIGDVFFREVLRKFPNLEVLQILSCDVDDDLQISSPSLKIMNLMQLKLKKVHFDVPSICEMTVASQNVPSLSFINYRKHWNRDWESTIVLPYWRYIEASWISKLQELLTELKHSKLTLSIVVFRSSDVLPLEHVSFPIAVVENLKIATGNSFSMSSETLCALLGGLFSSCRPKFVIRECTNFEDLELLYNTLRQQVYENCPTSSCNLVDFNVEFAEPTLMQWKPISWQAVLDVWESINDGKYFRFGLQWRFKVSSEEVL